MRENSNKMERILTYNLQVVYINSTLSVKEVFDHLGKFENVFVGRKGNNVEAIIYKNTRFDIKTDTYFSRTFKIEQNNPEVSGIKKEDVQEKIKSFFIDNSYKTVIVKGSFVSIYEQLKEKKERDKDDVIKGLEELLEEYKQGIEEYRKKISKLEKQLEEQVKKCANNTNNTNNTTNNIQINILNINCPDLDMVYQYIKGENCNVENAYRYKYIDLENIDDAIAKIVQLAHSDKSYPEKQIAGTANQ
jgi:vacuolar-type H+-ATPase subunit I/STV1